MKHTYIIGAGGVGSWLAPSVIMLLGKPDSVTIIDGDVLEEKNLNRQLFTRDEIGKTKAEALASKYGCGAIPKYFSHGDIELHRTDWVLCVVDNNASRNAVLESCDAYGCKAIFAANETHSSEAYYYENEWQGDKLDPRTYYPEIATDKSDDPRRAAIGCTGEAQVRNPQLVSANFMAASLCQHLLVLWRQEQPKMGREALPHLPYRIRQNLTKSEVFKVKD